MLCISIPGGNFLSELSFFFHSPSPAHFLKPHICCRGYWNGRPDVETLKKSLVYPGILSNQQGPTKEVAVIQRSILFKQTRRTSGMEGKSLKPGDRISFFYLVTNLSSLAPLRMYWSPHQSRCTGMWVVWGTNIFSMFFWGLLTHCVCHHKMYHISEAEI